jgi:hypothetical protein
MEALEFHEENGLVTTGHQSRIFGKKAIDGE